MLLLAAIAGAVSGAWVFFVRWRRWLAARWNRSSILLLILLAWLVPMTVRLGTLQVKYLRYWEPLVVPATLVAAWWLVRLPRRFRRRAIIGITAGTVIWGLAYIWAFADPHPHGTAARWLEPMLSDGQVVAFETWDESLALENSTAISNGSTSRPTISPTTTPRRSGGAKSWPVPTGSS